MRRAKIEKGKIIIIIEIIKKKNTVPGGNVEGGGIW